MTEIVGDGGWGTVSINLNNVSSKTHIGGHFGGRDLMDLSAP